MKPFVIVGVFAAIAGLAVAASSKAKADAELSDVNDLDFHSLALKSAVDRSAKDPGMVARKDVPKLAAGIRQDFHDVYKKRLTSDQDEAIDGIAQIFLVQGIDFSH